MVGSVLFPNEALTRSNIAFLACYQPVPERAEDRSHRTLREAPNVYTHLFWCRHAEATDDPLRLLLLRVVPVNVFLPIFSIRGKQYSTSALPIVCHSVIHDTQKKQAVRNA